ncbi:MAG: hypothetical protein ACRCTA_07560, partial [Bacilli bacterium]
PLFKGGEMIMDLSNQIAQASIIDLYLNNDHSLETILEQEDFHAFFSQYVVTFKDEVAIINLVFNEQPFTMYLKVIKQKEYDITKLNNVLVKEQDIKKASLKTSYLKCYLETNTNRVLGYYAQIKLLALCSIDGLCIVDNSQWCIYPISYLEMFLPSKALIIDTNLFKINTNGDNIIYTRGLGRFGVKDLIMNNINPDYIQGAVTFLSKLARYFIEFNQEVNTCQRYDEVFSDQLYTCIMSSSNYLDYIKDFEVDHLDLQDYVFVSVLQDPENHDFHYSNDETLAYLTNNNNYYNSEKHFKDLKILAQETINDIIDVIEGLQYQEDNDHLMIFYKDETITTEWYIFVERKDDIIYVVDINEEIHKINNENILNWNYKGITPINSYLIY